MMRRAAFLLSCAACNAVFGIDQTTVVPAPPPPPDTDGDGVIDADDNCPEVSNDQADADQDGVGDRCDNCPLVENPDQDLAGDSDGVGTQCDPHPTEDGDCFILFETFQSPDRFGVDWEVNASSPPAIEKSIGAITIRPAAGTQPVRVFARDDKGVLLAGRFDIELMGSVTIKTGAFYAVTNWASTPTAEGCGLRVESSSQAVPYPTVLDIRPAATYLSSTLLSGEPIDGTMTLRLTAGRPSDAAIGCRVDHGTAVGAARSITDSFPTSGGTGFVLYADAATVSAVAFYRQQAAACPPTIFR
jgi:hypothetical protein